MNLFLRRYEYGPDATLGQLSVDGQPFCWTVEPPALVIHSHIPEGKYEVAITFSNRFQKVLPLLLNVPGREAIRIHSGNTAKDTEGCVIVGLRRKDNVVLDSRLALAELLVKIQEGIQLGKVWITITYGAVDVANL